MTHANRKFSNSFEALPEEDQHEVLTRPLRRLMERPYSSLNDEELSGAVDMIFQDYDQREAQG